MSRFKSALWNFIGHNKYWLVIIIGLLIVGVLDENSFIKRIQYSMQKNELKEQIEEFDKEHQRNKAQLHELRRDPATIRKIARERYFMKTDDEDIFVLSDEILTEENNETTE